MLILKLALLVAAVLLFAIVAFGATSPRIDLKSAGLAFFAGSFLVPA